MTMHRRTFLKSTGLALIAGPLLPNVFIRMANAATTSGRKVLVAITTNEDLARLHPAVVRPGRCLARIEVPAFPLAEAEAWLGSPAGLPADGATLAELYALREGYETAVAREPVLSGQYL